MRVTRENSWGKYTVQQYILFLSQLKVRDNNIFVNYTYKNTIIFIIIIFTFDISVPLTSEMIDIHLPCNITEYKTLAISSSSSS